MNIFTSTFIFQLIENILILYYAVYLILEMTFFILFIYEFIRKDASPISSSTLSEFSFEDGITILVPAFNESVSIINCIEMLLKLEYPHYEIIVVNDGSEDDTLNQILSMDSFQTLEISGFNPIGTAKVKTVFQSTQFNKKVTVVDKYNGGKADALNVGINLAVYPYVCTIDADFILDNKALYRLIYSLKQKSAAIAGGELAVLNESVIVNGELKTAKFPGNIWVMFQIIEYIKSFMVSRTGLGKIKGLLVMSGAFSLFRKYLLKAAGGFLSKYNHHPTILKYFKSSRQTVVQPEAETILLHYEADISKYKKNSGY